jgi:hypothetical protein
VALQRVLVAQPSFLVELQFWHGFRRESSPSCVAVKEIEEEDEEQEQEQGEQEEEEEEEQEQEQEEQEGR